MTAGGHVQGAHAVDAPPEEPLSGRAYLRLILLGGAIGLPAALVAALFLALVHDLQHRLWNDLPDALGHDSPPWFLVLGLPVVGGDPLYSLLQAGNRSVMNSAGMSIADSCNVSGGAHEDDADTLPGGTRGFWFFLNFEAELITWTGP